MRNSVIIWSSIKTPRGYSHCSVVWDIRTCSAQRDDLPGLVSYSEWKVQRAGNPKTAEDCLQSDSGKEQQMCISD